MIDINKKYQTRDGREVRIYAVDRPGKFPVCGDVIVNNVWTMHTWTIEGHTCTNGEVIDLDLIEVREKKTASGWVNIYPNGIYSMYDSKEKADLIATDRRIACKYIEIEYEEGEGL